MKGYVLSLEYAFMSVVISSVVLNTCFVYLSRFVCYWSSCSWLVVNGTLFYSDWYAWRMKHPFQRMHKFYWHLIRPFRFWPMSICLNILTLPLVYLLTFVESRLWCIDYGLFNPFSKASVSTLNFLFVWRILHGLKFKIWK